EWLPCPGPRICLARRDDSERLPDRQSRPRTSSSLAWFRSLARLAASSHIASHATQFINLRPDVASAHEGLANQHRAHPSRLKSEHVLPCADTALAHQATV